MSKSNYTNLKKLLSDFEAMLNKSKLTTDEISDLMDRIGWLQETICNKEGIDE